MEGSVKGGTLWSKKDRQEAGAFLGQFDPSKSGRARRKKNTNYSNIVRKYFMMFQILVTTAAFAITLKLLLTIIHRSIDPITCDLGQQQEAAWQQGDLGV